VCGHPLQQPPRRFRHASFYHKSANAFLVYGGGTGTLGFGDQFSDLVRCVNDLGRVFMLAFSRVYMSSVCGFDRVRVRMPQSCSPNILYL
jgi:hypothetical protein